MTEPQAQNAIGVPTALEALVEHAYSIFDNFGKEKLTKEFAIFAHGVFDGLYGASSKYLQQFTDFYGGIPMGREDPSSIRVELGYLILLGFGFVKGYLARESIRREDESIDNIKKETLRLEQSRIPGTSVYTISSIENYGFQLGLLGRFDQLKHEYEHLHHGRKLGRHKSG